VNSTNGNGVVSTSSESPPICSYDDIPMPDGHATIKPRPRVRRSGAELQRLLLDAARELFAENGYRSTTTRMIAARAGVPEPLLYKHFGTKARLFELAVIKPFRDFVSDYATRWVAESRADMTVEELCREFITALFRLFHRNKEIVMALVAAHAYDMEEVGGNGSPTAALGEAIKTLEGLSRTEVHGRELVNVDPDLTVRLTVGMVMAMAVLDEWLFPTGPKPSQKRLIDEMTSYMTYGVTARPPG